MPRRVLGRMEQEAQDGRSRLSSADGAGLGQGQFVGDRELLLSPAERLPQRSHQLFRAWTRLGDGSLAGKVRTLALRERLPSGIGAIPTS